MVTFRDWTLCCEMDDDNKQSSVKRRHQGYNR